MSLKPTEPRSIASQLVIRFTGAAVLLLCCGLGVLYWIVIRHAFGEDNAVLADKIAALRGEIGRAENPAVLEQVVQARHSGERVSYWVRIIDQTGRTVAETPGMEAFLPALVFPPARSSTTPRWTPTNFRKGGKLFALAASAEANGPGFYTLQLAQDRSVDEEFRRRFGLLVVAVLVCGALASALIALRVTHRALQPLAQMTASLHRVGPHHLHERLAPADWPRELKPLATAFAEMLERLENSFTRLSQFSADLAHELRTPIANLRGEAEVILRRARSSEEYREVIESSVAECERLSHLIDQLLFLARADAAETPLQRERFAARVAVEKIAAYFDSVAEERGVTIRCQGEGEVAADSALFDRAISNLIDNSLHFTPRGGTILISVVPAMGETEIQVQDTGLGITPEHLPRVFDRFYRADSSRSSEGSGLGLAIVKSIVELHGGSAAIASELGRGTTVTLSFPAPHQK